MPRKACLDSLPTEVKVRIAEECDRWDRVRRQTPCELWRRRIDGSHAFHQLDEAKSCSAIGAMMAVSREWRSNCAAIPVPSTCSALRGAWAARLPLLDQTVTAKQCATPLFVLVLQPLYGRFVKILELNAVFDPSTVQSLLASLRTLVGRITEVHVPDMSRLVEALELTLPETTDWSYEQRMRMVSADLYTIVICATTVHLGAEVFLGSHSLCNGSTLRKLKVSVHCGSKRSFVDLLYLIRSCSSLVDLDILHLEADEGTPLESVTASAIRCSRWPAVRRLSILWWRCPENLHFIVSALASTLVQLEIDLLKYEVNPGSMAIYASLESMALRGHQTPVIAAISGLTPMTVPKLRQLTWYAGQRQEIDQTLILANVKRHVPGLLRAFSSTGLPIAVDIVVSPGSTLLSRKLHARGLPDCVRFITDPLDPAPVRIPDTFAIPDRIRRDTSSLVKAQEDIHDLLQDIGRMTDAATAGGDRVELAEIAQALQECARRRHLAML